MRKRIRQALAIALSVLLAAGNPGFTALAEDLASGQEGDVIVEEGGPLAPDGRTEEPADGQAEQPAEGQAEQPAEDQTGGPVAVLPGQPAEGQAEQPAGGRTEQPGDGQAGGPDVVTSKPTADNQAEGRPTVEVAEEPVAEAQVEAARTSGVASEGDKAEQTAFEQSATVDGVTVTVRADPGVFPTGVRLSVGRASARRQARADAAVEEAREEGQNVAVSHTLDVKVTDAEGNELQPAEGRKVSVSFSLAEVADENLSTRVYHVTEEGGTGRATAEELDVTTEVTPGTGEETTATVETGGFSLYTVEFTYGDLQYVMRGDTSVPLGEVLSTLGLAGEVEAVEVSDPGLFSASDGTGEWVVTAHRAFDTAEWMDVAIGGVTYRVTVTDAQAVTYVDEKGGKHVTTNYRLLEYHGTDTGMNNGVYVTTDDVDGYDRVKGIIRVVGDVTLIIKGTFFAEGVLLATDSSLTIYCAEGCEEKRLEIRGDRYEGICGFGELTLCSGTVVAATKVKYKPAFGGEGGTRIKGGTLVARCDGLEDTAAVGGYGKGHVTISGGTVEAVGSPLAAAIGGNSWTEGHVTISGGTVKAKGGSRAAGIGGGYKSGGHVTITGGTVEAHAAGAAAIGGGQGGYGGGVEIRGGDVKATGYVGIGGVEGNCGPVTITGGTVSATGDDRAIGASSGYYVNGDIRITGGRVTAKSTGSTTSGIGTVFGGRGRLVLGWTSPSDRISGDFKSGDYRPGSVALQSYFWLGDVGMAALSTNLDGRTLIPSQTANVYRASFYADGATEPWKEQTLLPGATLSDPGNPYAGSAGIHFPGWRLGDYSGSTYEFGAPVTGDLSLYAPKQYVVTVRPKNGQPDTTVYVDSGQRIARPEDPTQSGATFLGWCRAGDGGDYDFDSPVDAPFALEAAWQYQGIEYVGGATAAYTSMAALDGKTTLGAGDYVVLGDAAIDDRLEVSGTVNLILCDGATLTLTQGITVSEGNTLNIYGQSGGTGRLCAQGPERSAAIGSPFKRSSGQINIYGGDIEAKGGREAAAIGSGVNGWGHVAVLGGKVNAEGLPGIGGYSGADVVIRGGEVTSTGIGSKMDRSTANVTIYGGTVTSSAQSTYLPGIGGGYKGTGNIAIYGGTITATGGSWCPGIGGGYKGTGNVTFRWDDGCEADPIVLSNTRLTNPTFERSFMVQDTGELASIDNMMGRAIVPCYALRFDGNGGAGEMAGVAVGIGRSVTLPDCGFDAPAGREFVCWTANGVEYQPGQTITPTGDLTLSALWLTPQTLAFASVTAENPDGAVEKRYGDGPFTNAVNGASTAVTWYSSDATVATVDKATGEVAILDVGETIIYAIAARTEDHAEGIAAYTLTVGPRSVTPTPVVSGSYVYSGEAVVPSLDLKDGDDEIDQDEYSVTLSGNVHAGTATATVTDAAGGRYEFEPVTADFTIDPKPVTVSGIRALSKHYDGNTDAALDCSGAAFGGLVEGDVLGVTATGAFVTAEHGQGVTVTLSDLALTGRDRGDYILAGSGQQAEASADIYAPHTVRFVDHDGKEMADGAFAAQTVLNGQTAAAPVITDANRPSWEGYRFVDGWNVWDGADTGEAFDFSKPLDFDSTATVTLTPRFSKLYDVFTNSSLVTAGNGSFSIKSLQYPDASPGTKIQAVEGERIAVYATPQDNAQTFYSIVSHVETGGGSVFISEEPLSYSIANGHAEFVMPAAEVAVGGKFVLGDQLLDQLRDETDSSLYHIRNVSDLVLLQDWKNTSPNRDMDGWTLSLDKDLDMDGTSFSGFQGVFRGTFDGNGHTISNMAIWANPTSGGVPGLFWNLAGTVRDLTITGSVTNAQNKNGTGGLVGCVDANNVATLTNCTVIMDAYDPMACLVYLAGEDSGDKDGTLIVDNCFYGKAESKHGYGTRLYTIDLDPDNGDGITVSNLASGTCHLVGGRAWFEAGSDVTMNLTARERENYTLVGFQHDGDDLAQNDDGTYTLSNIQEDVTSLTAVYRYHIDLEYEDNKYLVNSVDDLNKVAQAVRDTGGCVDMHFLLKCDLEDVGRFEGIAVGLKDSYGDELSFQGTFDGGGHAISGMTVGADADSVGFIGNLQGTLTGLTLRDCYVTNAKAEGGMAGMLAGRAYSGTLEHCRVLGGSVAGACAGAIAGVFSSEGSDNLYDSNVTVTSGGEAKGPGTCGTADGDRSYVGSNAATVAWTVSFVDGFDASVEMAEPQLVANESAAKAPTVTDPPAHAHYTFSNAWQRANDELYGFSDVNTPDFITGDTTLYARWDEEAAYTVTLSDGQDEPVTVDMKVYVSAAQEWKLPDGKVLTPPVGHELDKWVYGDKSYDAGATIPFPAAATDPIAVTATWKAVDYSLTINDAEHGKVEAAATATYNATVPVAVTPDTGYALDTLTCETPRSESVEVTSGEGGYAFTMPADNVTLTATFKPVDYTIAATLGHGTLRVNRKQATAPATAHYGDTVSVWPDEGYALESLSVKQGETDVPVTDDTFTMPAGAVTVTATFREIPKHTITFVAGYESPSGTMASVTVDEGSAYVLPSCGFAAPAGKAFKGWSVMVGDAAAEVMVPGDMFEVTADATATATWEEVPVQVYGHSLTLEGTIGVNTYLIPHGDAKAHPSDYQVEFWRDGALVSAKKVSDGKLRKEGDYDLLGSAVTAVAKEMDAAFTMKVRGPDGAYVNFAGADGALVDGGEGLRYSVNDYLDDMSVNGSTDALKQLCKDMRAYGAYARHYFGKRDVAGWGEARPEIAGFQTVSEGDLSGFVPEIQAPIDHFTYVGSTLVLEEGTRFRLYFTSDDPSKLVATCRVSGTQATAAKLDIEEGTGGFSKYHYVEVPNIVAKQLGDMYEFTFTNTDKNQTATVKHGPYAYVRWAVGTSDENLKYVASALYRYGVSAKAYFPQQQ